MSSPVARVNALFASFREKLDRRFRRLYGQQLTIAEGLFPEGQQCEAVKSQLSRELTLAQKALEVELTSLQQAINVMVKEEFSGQEKTRGQDRES